MDNPQLELLTGGYYHEDFDVYGGMWGALDLYLTQSTAADRQQLRHELETFLAGSDEAQAEALLDELHCAVYLDDEPGGYRGWLEEIYRRVSAAP